jgi:hypothetical protein
MTVVWSGKTVDHPSPPSAGSLSRLDTDIRRSSELRREESSPPEDAGRASAGGTEDASKVGDDAFGRTGLADCSSESFRGS